MELECFFRESCSQQKEIFNGFLVNECKSEFCILRSMEFLFALFCFLLEGCGISRHHECSKRIANAEREMVKVQNHFTLSHQWGWRESGESLLLGVNRFQKENLYRAGSLYRGGSPCKNTYMSKHNLSGIMCCKINILLYTRHQHVFC